MSDNPQLTIEIELDDGTIKKGVAKLPEHFKGPAQKAGENFGDEFNGAITTKLQGLRNIITSPMTLAFAGITATILTVRAAINELSDSISEAAEEQNAVNQLNAALMQTGRYSTEVSNSLSEYATQMQKTTKFSDDAVLSGMALIQTLTNLDEKGLKRTTRAAADLASGLRIDLNSAFMLLGKAAEGEISSLGRYGMKVEEGATKAETFAKVLGTIEAKMGGRASSDINTYTGSLALMNNAYKNMLGELGNFIVKSPLVIAFAKEMTRILNLASDSLGAKSGNKKLGTELAESFMTIGTVINYAIIGPLEIVYNLSRLIMNGLMTIGQGVNTAGMSLIANAANLLPDAIVSQETKNKLFKKTDDLMKSTVTIFQKGGEIAGDLFSNPITSKINESIMRMRGTIAELSVPQARVEQSPVSMTQADHEETEAEEIARIHSGKAVTIANVYENMGQSVAYSFRKMAVDAKTFSANIANSLTSGLVNGAGQAFASFGKALVEGDNALKAMAKSFISTLGGMCVQIGTMFIAQGAAMAFSMNPLWQAQAGPLIGAGAALAVLGGAMQAFSGGSTSTGSSASSGSTGTTYESTTSSSSSTASASSSEKEKKGTSLTVNIHGDVLDSEETGIRIVNLINNAVNGNGAVFA